MRKIFFFLVIISFISFSHYSNGQVGINNLEPFEGAAVHIKSDSMGVIFPMIGAHEELMKDTMGLFYYNTTFQKFFVNNGSNWQCVNPFNTQNPNNISAPGSLNINNNLNVANNLTSKNINIDQNINVNNLTTTRYLTVNRNLEVGGNITVQNATTLNNGLKVEGGDLVVKNGNKIVGLGAAPIGTIVMWSGSINNIPKGWQICNGSNGTINLIDQFIFGSNSSGTVEKIQYRNRDKYYIDNDGGCEEWPMEYEIKATWTIIEDNQEKTKTSINWINGHNYDDALYRYKNGNYSIPLDATFTELNSRTNTQYYRRNETSCTYDDYGEKSYTKIIFIQRIE